MGDRLDARSAADYGYPERPLNTERTAVILGNAHGRGELHYRTVLRAYFPEYARELDESRELRRASRRRCAARSARELHAADRPLCSRRSPKTACPASWPTASPGRRGECVQLPRSELRLRRRVRVRDGGDPRRDRRPGRERVRRRGDGRRGPQHGRLHVHQVLQDRRAFRDRQPSVRRGRRRLRHGRRRRRSSS